MVSFMLQFDDEALILSVDKYGDHDAIVQLFTPQHGMVRGVIKRALTSKRRADMQPATLVQASWKARLPEHMGSITLEAQHSYGARVMADPLKLSAVGSVMSLIAASLAEHDAHPELYQQTVSFLQHVAADVAPLVWMAEYVRLELALLELAGFGLDLSECAATGTRDELVYVSPKSGRAVSRGAGAPYHERMLALPEFVRVDDHLPDDVRDIRAGVTLTGHFLESRMLPALHRKPPPLRGHFVSLLSRRA